MKIAFEKFYKTTDGKKRFATSSALPLGKAIQITEEMFAVVDLPGDLTSLAEMAREEWVAAKLPISIEIHWSGDPVEAPAKRELTPEEKKLDEEYRVRQHEVRAARMQAIRQALADREHPLVEIETTTITGYSSVPLASALGQFLAPGPDPIDPISWRKDAGKVDRSSLVTAIVEALGPIVAGIVDRKAQATSAPEHAEKL